jgi:2-dehydro-3-deoxyphosphogluconate aldolase/(4S)-4-hydroxy-2-oxoglutarate aldolase
LATAPNYLALNNVICIGGSWLTPASAIQKADWEAIARLAHEAVTTLRKK